MSGKALEIKNRAEKTMENAYVFSIFAKVISIITGLIYSVLLARYLGSELRGDALIIMNYSEIISLVLCLGVYQAYPYFRKKTKKNIYMDYINNTFGMFLCYLLIAVIVCLSTKISTNLIVAIMLTPMLVAIKQLNYAILVENPKLWNMTNVKLDLFDIVLLIILTICTDANYFFCIIFLLVKHFILFFIAVINLKISILTIRPTIKGLVPYVKFGIIPMITLILMEINYKVDVLMLDWLQVDKADIGVYSIGVMIAQKIWMIPDSLKDILLSKLAKGKSREEVSKVTRICFVVTLFMIIGMAIVGKSLIRIMFGLEYSGAYTVTLIILAGVLGMVFFKMVYSYNLVNGYKKTNLIFLFITAVLNVVANAVLIPKIGTYGAALASLISYVICGLLFMFHFCINTTTPIKDMILLRKEDVNLLRKLLISERNSFEN